MQCLGPDFMTQLVSAAKESPPDSTVRAKENTSPLNGYALDTASLQAQLQVMNKNRVSSNSVITFDDVEVTGVVENTHHPSLYQAFFGILSYYWFCLNYGASLQWLVG